MPNFMDYSSLLKIDFSLLHPIPNYLLKSRFSISTNKKLHHKKMELLSANNVRDQKFIQIWQPSSEFYF